MIRIVRENLSPGGLTMRAGLCRDEARPERAVKTAGQGGRYRAMMLKEEPV
jgi:hypothetical protein